MEKKRWAGALLRENPAASPMDDNPHYPTKVLIASQLVFFDGKR